MLLVGAALGRAGECFHADGPHGDDGLQHGPRLHLRPGQERDDAALHSPDLGAAVLEKRVRHPFSLAKQFPHWSPKCHVRVVNVSEVSISVHKY